MASQVRKVNVQQRACVLHCCRQQWFVKTQRWSLTPPNRSC